MNQIETEDVMAMEDLPINEDNGQSYGYVVYRTYVNVPEGGTTLTIRGHVRDLLLLLVDGEVLSHRHHTPEDLNTFGAWVKRYDRLTV